MANRKKRLKKGIESIEEEIEKHQEKREKAIEEGKIELSDYYGKEIESLKRAKNKKEKMLGIDSDKKEEDEDG